jgi:diguanylate cyclase (GGDEF)-like protein
MRVSGKLHREGGRVAALLVRTVETLALAVEAHGGRSTDWLESVRVKAHALAIGRLMGLRPKDQDALCMAAMVRSFGELGPEELEKMKIHPSIGAAIAERVQFPFPVAPIVRSHHERWDGSGYPDGLKGQEIPLGARILAAADCLAALPPAEALDALAAGAGSGFDPEVVRVILQNHGRLQQAAKRAAESQPQPAFYAAIAAARHEERSVAALIAALRDELGNSLSLHETLSVFDTGLKRLVAYDCIAVYLPQKDRLSPAYVNGANSRLFCSLEIPYGKGPSGHAASTRQPVLNQDPSAEAGDDGGRGDCATLAVPLESGAELIGVLALYHASPGVFGDADLRTLLSVRAKLARAMENALKHERAEQVSAVDPLTALSNGRGLFLRLDADLARCRRNHAELAVVVCHVTGLKQVEQRFGPLACAPLHQSIAAGLRRICREDDCVARLEDEFVLVLGGFQARDVEEKRKLIESLLDEIGDADLGARVLAPKLGAAYYPEDGAYAEDLLAAAGSRLNQSHPRVGQAGWPVLPIC